MATQGRLHYHQTQDLTQTQLEIFETAAMRQEDLILNLFKRTPGGSFTSEDLLPHFPGVPITSIRRALTNIANGGQIEKTGQDEGMYGRPINRYKLRRGTP